MNFNSDLPGYEEIFGVMNIYEVDDALSILSPAAYLVDLLQILDDDLLVDEPKKTIFNGRRLDIKELLLNQENTYKSTPYLDIVNGLLEREALEVQENDSYKILRTATYPLNLPFNLENERIKRLFYYLNVNPEEIYKLFHLKLDSSLAIEESLNIIARESLGLSEEEFNAIAQPADKDTLTQYFGNLNFSEEAPLKVSHFLQVTHLSPKELRELLWQNLSTATVDSNANTERSKACDLFINSTLKMKIYTTFSSKKDSDGLTDEMIVWITIPDGKSSPSISEGWFEHPEDWFDRVSRLIRLNKKIGLSLTDLDLILRSCCHNKLDEKAIRNIAVVKQICDRYGLAIDVVCSFFSSINILGIGDDQDPQDLFNQIFNLKFAHVERKYIQISDFVPKQYEKYTPLVCLDDLLSLNNKEYRKRLYQSLEISEVELIYIVRQFRERSKDKSGPSLLNSKEEISLSALSLLFRISQLSKLLNLSCEDLFNLFDILEQDPTIRRQNNFNILIHQAPLEQDCYKIIAGDDVQASMWLVQNLCEISKWMEAQSFTTEELKQWLTGTYKDDLVAAASRKQKISFLNNLYQQFKSVMFNAEVFESDVLDDRTARIIYQTFIEKSSGLVANQDNRLIRYTPDLVEKAAYQALSHLEKISKEDFINLGVEQKMLDKIFNNLIFRGYITTEGSILEAQFPKSVEQFELETDFSTHQEDLFTIIYKLLLGVMELDEDENMEIVSAVELAIYPSDLEGLTELTAKGRDELYDNLIFNGYIDEEGNVLQTDFFVSQDNIDYFEVNAGLNPYSTSVFNLILSQFQRFNQEKLVLEKENFSALPLKPFEIDDLLENLKFNGYINQEQVLVDKGALLTETPETFNLALAFYPHRRQILKAIQNHIYNFKVNFYTLNKELFVGIANEIVAQRVYQQIEVGLLEDGVLEEETFFLDSDNLKQFSLSRYFTENDTEVIFKVVQNIIKTSKKYRFYSELLEELDFNLGEQEELVNLLEETGYLFNRSHLHWDKVDYFLTIDNALDFTLAGFEDYNKDIFFILHAIAKVIDDHVHEITTRFQTLADVQEGTLLEILQDHFGVETDVIKTICQHVLQNSSSLVEEFLIPTLAAVDIYDAISEEPHHNKFNLAYRRIGQFAAIAAKLGLNQAETEIVWQDQDLVEKFPEKLALPPGIDRFDALLDDGQGTIYLFKDKQYWTYSAEKYNLLTPQPKALTTLSDQFSTIPKVDTAFADQTSKLYLIAQDILYCKAPDSDLWVKQERLWGKVASNFSDWQQIDATFQDKNSRTYLFSGNQYIRYSRDNYQQLDKGKGYVDEGYPLKIEKNWKQDAINTELPKNFQKSIDASFQDINGKTYLFEGDQYICLEISETEKLINQTWGQVRNNFDNLRKIDAAYTDGYEVFIFSADQVAVYQDSLENPEVTIKEGFPKRLSSYYKDLPIEFSEGVDAALKGVDGKTYLFKSGKAIEISSDRSALKSKGIKNTWGVVRNNILNNGNIDAAFVGLDGDTYLFSGDQYVRYSGDDYAQVDEGFPRTIEQDWGSLIWVNAAFVLDGKTYLFGKTQGSDRTVYVRYSTHDYTKVDEGYPKPPNDNWWNLPVSLVEEGAAFEKIDTVFNSQDKKMYLFSGGSFIYFDQQERWWSEPQTLKKHWDSIPFESVDAAFTGKDGKTYIFSGTEYVRYSSQDYSRTDDRYPNITNRYWWNVANNIAKTGRIDAALVVESYESIDEYGLSTVHTALLTFWWKWFVNIQRKQQSQVDALDQWFTSLAYYLINRRNVYTYLFSGNQYFRYQGNQYDEVEEGYPKYIATSLKLESRFKNLSITFEDGIDAAFADQRNIYLFKGAQCHVVSETLYKPYDIPHRSSIRCAFMDEGTIFVEHNDIWYRHSSLEVKTNQNPHLPALVRNVPQQFQTGLQTLLQGIDRNTYLFKNSDCFNVSLYKSYPLNEEWGRIKNNIDIHSTIDAAFVGRDHKTYLFSGNQFVSYSVDSFENSQNDSRKIEHLPQAIAEYWGGLTRVALAFVKDEKTYLFEPADAQGNARYICYSTADYSRPDPGFPKVGDSDFWQIPSAYADENFLKVDAVLYEGDNVFLLHGQDYIQFNTKKGQWAAPKPMERIWRHLPFNQDTFQRVKTAFTGRNGITYFFSDEYYVAYANNQLSKPTPIPIRQHWGIPHNNFVNHPQGNRVDAAVVLQDKITFLFSRDQYVRYSGQDYRYVDEGYPKSIARNLRKEVGFQNLPTDFEKEIAALITARQDRLIGSVLVNDRSLYILVGDQWHVVSQSLTASYPLNRLGRLKNNLVQQNKVDAALLTDDGKTYLFSGDQGVRYSDDTYTYVDDGYPQALSTIFVDELKIRNLTETFKYGIDAILKSSDGKKFYVFKGKEYQRSDQSTSTPISNLWGKVRNNFWEPSGKNTIDTAFMAPNGTFYAFKGDQYIRYTNFEQEFVDEGFPKLIRDNWGNLPIDFENAGNSPVQSGAGISGAFVFEGKTYLLQGEDYVRYSQPTYQLVDSIYPQKIKHRWGNWSDFLLNDLQIITRFKQLQDTYGNGEYTLLDFLHSNTIAVKDPYKMLADIFSWNIDEVKWLKRKNAFLRADDLFENKFKLETIIQLFDIFAIAQKMGTSPSDLYMEFWQKRYESDKLKGYSFDLTTASTNGTLPEIGKRLIAIHKNAQENLYFRIFDIKGNQVIDLQEIDLTKRKKNEVAKLKKQLELYWDSGSSSISLKEKEEIIDAITSITGYTQLKDGPDPLKDAADALYRFLATVYQA